MASWEFPRTIQSIWMFASLRKPSKWIFHHNFRLFLPNHPALGAPQRICKRRFPRDAAGAPTCFEAFFLKLPVLKMVRSSFDEAGVWVNIPSQLDTSPKGGVFNPRDLPCGTSGHVDASQGPAGQRSKAQGGSGACFGMVQRC